MLSSLMEKVCLCGLVVLCSFVVFTKSDERLVNYVATSVLPDGEREIRMRFRNVIVRETSFTQENKFGIRRGLLLRQVAAGPHFLQIIYKMKHEELSTPNKRRRIAECEVINDWGSASKFRNQFQEELKRAGLNLQVPANRHFHLIDSKDDNSTREQLESNPEDWIIEGVDDSEVEPIDLDQGMEELRNVTVRMLKEDEMTPEMKKSVDVHMQQRQCRRLHRKMKQIVNAKSTIKNADSSKNELSPDSKRRIKREAFRVGIMPGTLWCGDGSLAEDHENMGAHVWTDRCCRQHDGCPLIIDAMSSKFGMFNYRMHTISHCTCDESVNDEEDDKSVGARRRWKRELGSTFQMPGTQWCGRGFSATEQTHLGGFTGADKCCRTHDLGCPFYIEAFEEKYGIYNWRMYTINHCSCDERFRSCLKQTSTGAANFVGKIFFNVVQTKCFVLKPEKNCVKMSWWGKCLKYEYKKQAHLRDPIPY